MMQNLRNTICGYYLHYGSNEDDAEFMCGNRVFLPGKPLDQNERDIQYDWCDKNVRKDFFDDKLPGDIGECRCSKNCISYGYEDVLNVFWCAFCWQEVIKFDNGHECKNECVFIACYRCETLRMVVDTGEEYLCSECLNNPNGEPPRKKRKKMEKWTMFWRKGAYEQLLKTLKKKVPKDTKIIVKKRKHLRKKRDRFLWKDEKFWDSDCDFLDFEF